MKTVGIAELKARLSAFLKAVQKGHPITVVDRGRAVARILPIRPEGRLVVRAPLRPLHSAPLPPPVTGAVDSLSALLEERRERR